MMFIGYVVFTRLSPNFLNCWLLGVFSYFLVYEGKRSGILILALALAFLGAAISQFQSETLSVSRNALISLLPSRHIATLIESTGIGLLIASICRIQPTSKLMITVEKAGTSLAAFSYTLYLTHYPILNLWEHFVPERSPSFTAVSFAIFTAKICSCLLVGWLLYLPFEAKTPAVRAWLRSRWAASSYGV
jgi:peptidoglycan/LPS O-acetylase OafA/YrhL